MILLRFYLFIYLFLVNLEKENPELVLCLVKTLLSKLFLGL